MQKDDTAKNPLILVEVTSIDEHIKKIEQNDGKTVMPKIAAGELGLYARVQDTEGNIIGLWEQIKHK